MSNEDTGGVGYSEAKRMEVALVMQQNATSYDEWARASQELDLLCGNDKWKSNPISDKYDYKLVAKRLKELRETRTSGNFLKLLFLLRTTLSRNFADIGNSQLYLHSHIGTKSLIDDYISECEISLKTVLNNGINNVNDYTKLDELLRTRHAYGRTALLLSGGGTMGMLHSGVVQVLLECNLLPMIISGSSAGGIIAAIVCTRTDAELPTLLEDFSKFNLDVFEITGHEESSWTRIARFLKHGAWTDISYLVKSMQEILGELTFQEAYNRTRRVLNIPVSSASLYETARLLNYITSPNVYIWSAVCASCSVPLVFSSHTLLAKDPKTNKPIPWHPSPLRWIDGSVANDLPMSRLNEMFNVNHFIVSQVNPHVIPFLRTAVLTPDDSQYENIVNRKSASLFSFSNCSDYEDGGSKKKSAAGRSASAISTSVTYRDKVLKLALSETMHRLLMCSEMGILPSLCTRLRSVLAQTYSGDITILPEVYISELSKILKNPTPQFLENTKVRGQRATFPKISIIRNHCAVELALDAAILELRS
ncbi:acyl transferase/acyl hydrolase/lysophospholipase, partial [Dipodascopsis uninucleata]